MTKDWRTFSPRNTAFAANVKCEECLTWASAKQVIVATGGPAELSQAGRARLQALETRVEALEGGLATMTLEALLVELDAAYAELAGHRRGGNCPHRRRARRRPAGGYPLGLSHGARGGGTLSHVSDGDPTPTRMRLRREPPRFRRLTVTRVTRLGPWMVRVTLAGPELEGFAVDQPGASVRLLLPAPGDELVVPTWEGNEFLLPDGSRPTIRTFTPRRLGDDGLDVDIVLHDGGAASAWAEAAEPGAAVALSGPGRGYAIDPEAPGFVLAGDETAIPAISQLLEAIPEGPPVQVQIEVARPDARLDLPDRSGTTVEWCDLAEGSAPGDALVAAVCGTDVAPGTPVWVAGEAAAVQRIRRHLFEERGLPRSQATVRGYWKHGRSGGGDGD